jgi:hypothetical protein
MRRRDLITLLGGAGACGARATAGQAAGHRISQFHVGAGSVQRIRVHSRAAPLSQNNVNHILPYRRHT